MTIFDRLKEMIQDQGLMEEDDLENVSMDSTFDELNLDSLDLADLAMSCEDEFEIQLDLDNPPKTVGELVDMIKEQTGLDE